MASTVPVALTLIEVIVSEPELIDKVNAAQAEGPLQAVSFIYVKVLDEFTLATLLPAVAPIESVIVTVTVKLCPLLA